MALRRVRWVRWCPAVCLLLASGVCAHGTMQLPLPWQLGNVQSDLNSNSCVSGGCNWFENATRTSAATMPQHSPLRTFADVGPDFEDWSARNPWRAPGTAAVSSPCGSEGGNPRGCVQLDGKRGPCVTDDGGFAYGSDGRSLGGLGVITSWPRGGVVEAGWSIRSNHGGGYSYRLCRKPRSGNWSDVTEACFQRTPLDFVGNTSFIAYADGERYEIDAVRTTSRTHPAGSMWSRNPIPCFGQGNNVQGTGTQFALPTFRGKPVRTPAPLAGFCPCRKNNNGHSGHDAAASVKPAWVAGAAARTCYCCCGCCAANRPEPSFDDWIIVDRLRVPANLPTGEYALGFRWDCEQSPQVWQQCATINITSSGPSSSSDDTVSAPAARKPASLCGDSGHACCMRVDAHTGACVLWSAVNTCVQSRAHCENGTRRVWNENVIKGCGGKWMARVPMAQRCVDARSEHACGYGCAKSATPTSRWSSCTSYAAVGRCTSDRAACEGDCGGAWVARP